MYVLSFTSLTTQKTLTWEIRKTKLGPYTTEIYDFYMNVSKEYEVILNIRMSETSTIGNSWQCLYKREAIKEMHTTQTTGITATYIWKVSRMSQFPTC